jgi:hypothetical protein
MKFSIDLDYDQVGWIIWNQLVYTRDMFQKDLEEINSGVSRNIFCFGDNKKDLAEIKKHIDALDILIEWYRIPE